MKYRFLGRSGLQVSELAMGTQTFGWGVDQQTANRMAGQFVQAGGNLFDTSSTYNDGESERILGSWLGTISRRESVVIATKVFFQTGEGPNDFGLSRKHILATVDRSLDRLGTDYVDLLQAHCFDMSTPIEETLRAFDDLVSCGKVRYLGVSNFTPSQLMKTAMLSRIHDYAPIVSLQAEYSLIVRSTEWELLPVCREEGIALLAWSPLAGGWLSGKYQRGRSAPPDSRVGRGDRWDDKAEQRESELTWRVIDALTEIAAARGKSVSQVALNYILGHPDPIIPIFGARTPDQLATNLGSVDWSLDEAERQKLSDASAVPLPYPYRFVERYTRRPE